MATKIQSFYRAFRAKKAYKLVVSSVLKVQKWFRILKLAQSWNFVEAMKNVRNGAASTVQKYMRGYLEYKHSRTRIALSTLN